MGFQGLDSAGAFSISDPERGHRTRIRGVILAMRLIRDTEGAALVEATVMMTIIFVFVLGGIDFLFAFYEWNAASKAVELGARVAVVSNPVDPALNALSAAAVSSTVAPGGVMPAFKVKCDGNAATCTCVSGTCGTVSYDATAMATIVTSMSNLFNRIATKNVVITYTQTGLGYAGRPDGPIPTVDVSLQGLSFQFFFLGDLLGFANKQIMSALATSITGESLSSTAQCFDGSQTWPCT